MSLPPRTPRTGSPRSAAPGSNLKIGLGIAVVTLLVLLFVPRWRHASACIIAGGRWQKGTDGFIATECRMRSKTAGQPCTGQIRNECDHAKCDQNVKYGGASASTGTCPDAYAKSYYTKEGKFYKVF